MTKSTLILIFSLTSTILFAQKELKSSDISEFATTFKIENHNFIGVAADTLINSLSKSQFLLLGEQHYSPEISELTHVLLPKLRDFDFKYFAVEIGPNSAKKITQLMEEENSLYQFNTNFYLKYKDIPIPFFDGKKDEQFLKTALNEGFELWGIDQEFLSGPLFLIDDLFSLSKNKPNVKPYYESSKKFLEAEFEKYKVTNGYKMFTRLLNSQILKTFFKLCQTPEQKKMINDLITSWEIYELNDTRKYKENNRTRMRYMKKKLGDNYKIAEKTNPLPKVLIKMGSMHLVRGKNWLGNYDIGHTFKELAYFNGTQSTSINCFARFEENEDGTIFDYLDTNEGKLYQPILELAQKDKWVLLNAKSIVKFATKEKITLNKDLKILLTGFDFVLFSPMRTRVKPNYYK